MKKILIILSFIALICYNTNAGVPITRVDKIAPTDEVFMDMAVTAAKKAVSSGQAPCGAVIILNGAWRATGIPSAPSTAEQTAIAKSRLQSLENATIYTTVEPTTEAYMDLCRLGANAVYFVVDRDSAIKAGIYPADAYDDTKIPADFKTTPLNQMPYNEATELVAKYKK